MKMVVELLEHVNIDINTHCITWYTSELLDRAITELKAQPRFETPEQWETRTGEKLNELTPVWVRHVYHDDWFWHLGTYEEEKENNKYFEESGYKCDMVIATEAGPPPDDWRPEETT